MYTVSFSAIRMSLQGKRVYESIEGVDVFIYTGLRHAVRDTQILSMVS